MIGWIQDTRRAIRWATSIRSGVGDRKYGLARATPDRKMVVGETAPPYDQHMTVAPPPPASGWDAPTIPEPSAPPRSRARRAWALTGSITLAVLCSLLAIAVAGNDGTEGTTFPPIIRAVAGLGAFPMIAVSVLLVWRHRMPVLVSSLATGVALLVPTTPLPALIALAALAAARRGWLLWTMVAATYVATAAAFCWDIASPTSSLSDFVGSPIAGSTARLSLLWSVPVLAAFAVAPFAGFGIARRVRLERDAARRGTATATRNMAALHQEVSLERERQELAREIHDTLAARLSAVSLQAGALELTVGEENVQAAEAARAVRQSAQTSLEDLRNVVRVLRNPAAASASSTGLNDLGQLIDSSLREGTDVRAQILVTDPGSCDSEVAHACYRVVQESISNVRRHAPGATLFVEVRGGPETGLTIRAVNWLMPDAPRASSSGGHGLTGMSERAELVGGTFQAGPTAEGSFGVVAWLPWARR
ncbi:signal transduction histidine kinase [Leifsonia sp. EB41]|uniref:sensor histidine kinase n=1 Tax=Leifsonia sp. EB41 TaxID=3156260 RepID=UPI0035157FF3